PVIPSSGFVLGNTERPQLDAKEIAGSLVVATIYYLDNSAEDDFVVFFEHSLKPVFTAAGVSPLAYLVTETSANNFPALPVREGENVFIWFSHFRDESAYEASVVALTNLRERHGSVSSELSRRITREPEVLKLSPTERSQLR